MLLISPSGMQAEFNANGSLCRFNCADISLSLFVGNELEGGPTNLYLRRRGNAGEWTPLLGPQSRTRFAPTPVDGALIGAGKWLGISYTIALRFARSSSAWFWRVELENTNGSTEEIDLTYAQDLALAPYGAVRMNEFYVSQYIDHTELTDSRHGVAVASRQNAAVDGRYPWSLIGSLCSATSFATDALQLHALSARSGDAPPGLLSNLPGRRLQHEHSMVVIRDAPIRLAPRERVDAGFFGCFVADHPSATSCADVDRAGATLVLPEATQAIDSAALRSISESPPDCATLFSDAPLLNGLELSVDALKTLFGSTWRQEERTAAGDLLSFFYGSDRHVVLRSKEQLVQRPHGHLLRTGTHTTPDETGLTSTVWMGGVFHSMVTQGHVSINRMLSTVHSYIGLFRSHGQRVFVDVSGEWQLLGIPSAFEISPEACRWVYRHAEGVIEVRAEVQSNPHELRLCVEMTSGKAAKCLISNHVALNGDDGSTPGAVQWSRRGDAQGGAIELTAAKGSEVGSRFSSGGFQILPAHGTHFEQIGGDELLFRDGRSRLQPFLVIVTSPATSVGLRIRANLIVDSIPPPLRILDDELLIPTLNVAVGSSGTVAEQAVSLVDIAPWFAHNAMVHYLSPRGLEQYSGGGWGTRDVCQGPVEMLLALNRTSSIRDLLVRVMRQQNPDGDWPQWFMFFDRERSIRPGDSHGDIVFWPVLALAQYLIASGDEAFLDERVPFFDATSSAAGEMASVWQHVQRALSLIEKRVIPGTSLAAYGHGDWNDSLQPADPHLREHMCSAWTVTLHFQMLRALADALRKIGRTDEASDLDVAAQKVHQDFQRLLVVDGVLAGYAVFEDGKIRYLLHPNDKTTGLRYSSLAMIHAILEDMLTPAQIREHLKLIDAHLSGPDGVRLFDQPMAYHGGPQRLFQRAESATFFGREIGLMYTHAHLRYAQAMAHIGETQRFFHALCQANPIGIRAVIENATLRQANCYYSSSDAAFADRYEASALYQRVALGEIALDGGWRVYSSGAGIALGLIIRRFLGLSCEAQCLSVDPVMPGELDGLRVQMKVVGRQVEVTYRVGTVGNGVQTIEFNGRPVQFTRGANSHRLGAAEVPMSVITQVLQSQRNSMTVTTG